MELELYIHIYEQLARKLAKDAGWHSYRVYHERNREPRFRIELSRIRTEKAGFKVKADGVGIRAEWAELDRPNQSVVVHVLETDLHHPKSIDRLVRFARRAKRHYSRIKKFEDIVFLTEDDVSGTRNWMNDRAWRTEYIYHQSTRDPVVIVP